MGRQDEDVIWKLKKITAISVCFMILEIVGGYVANSIAIMADAFHLLSDVLAYIISLYAVYMSSKAGPPYLTFGYDKLQPLGALLNVAIIWIVTAELFIEATIRMYNKAVVEEPTYMLWTSLFGLGCNLYIMSILHADPHAGHHNCSHNHGPKPIDTEESSHNHVHGESCAHKHEPKPVHKHSATCSHGHDHHDHTAEKHEHKHGQHEHHEHGQGKCSHKHGEHKHEHDHGLSDLIPTEKATCGHAHSPVDKGEDFCMASVASDEQMKNKDEYKKKFQNINMQAAYTHILTDIILSIGVIFSALIIYFFAPPGWSYVQLADPLCTYFFSVMAIYTTIPITKEATLLLLDGCENAQLVADIEQQLKNDPAVKDIKDFKIWSTNRGKYYGALKAVVVGRDLAAVRGVFSSRGVSGFVELEEEEEELAGLRAEE